MTSKKSHGLGAPPTTIVVVSHIDQDQDVDERAGRLIAKAIGERWAAETIARIKEKLGPSANTKAPRSKVRPRSSPPRRQGTRSSAP